MRNGICAMLRCLVAFGTMNLFACTAPLSSQSNTQGLYMPGKTLPSQEAKVCWQQGDNRSSAHMQIVQEVVTAEYSRAGFNFTGWVECPAGAAAPEWIVVAVHDVNPSAFYGCQVNYGACVNLNFSFNSWPAGCDTSDWKSAWGCNCKRSDTVASCLQSYALHEFGHVTGLGHEALRRDSLCAQQADHDDMLTNYGSYDDNSIMNYCANQRMIEARQRSYLSPGDLETLAFLYPKSGDKAEEKKPSGKTVGETAPGTPVSSTKTDPQTTTGQKWCDPYDASKCWSYCTSMAEDDDGDGWSYENGDSCKMLATTDEQVAQSSESSGAQTPSAATGSNPTPSSSFDPGSVVGTPVDPGSTGTWQPTAETAGNGTQPMDAGTGATTSSNTQWCDSYSNSCYNYCQGDSDADANGNRDGWGYENGASCKMP